MPNVKATSTQNEKRTVVVKGRRQHATLKITDEEVGGPGK